MAPTKAGLIVTTTQTLPFPIIANFQARFDLGNAVQVVTQAGQLGESLARSSTAIFLVDSHSRSCCQPAGG
jgi:hypothetical protein